MKLYYDGKAVAEPEDIREQDKLFKYIDDEVAKARTSIAKPLDSVIAQLESLGQGNTKGRSDINPEGRVIHLTEATFPIMTKDSPWFVMFHAPWCGHCKALAPTWETVAPALKGINQPSPPAEYSGARKLQELTEYAMSFSNKAAFKVVKSTNIPTVLRDEEVAFLYLYNPDTAKDTSKEKLNAFLEAARSVRSSASVYVTPDPAAYSSLALNANQFPLLVAAKDNGQDIVSYTGDLTIPDHIRSFIMSNRLPLVPQLTSENQDEIMSGDNLVVLLVLDPLKPGREAAFSELRAAAKVWKDKEDVRKVVFAWLNGKKWNKYVNRVYGLSEAALESIIITDPKNDAFFDVDMVGRKISVDKQVLLSTVAGVLSGNGKPKYTTGFVANVSRSVRNATSALGTFLADNLLATVVLLAAIVGLCYYGGVFPGSGHRGYAKAE
ncbi:hypothetical protein HDV00_003211 [Rhizophlyctis rosea]|nr:hypothetical protein HDV00_003211 [Rhizophlyctis rosea]